jgi:putative ATP-dependent endonuclease of the OLD family
MRVVVQNPYNKNGINTMFINQLTIENYKCFSSPFSISFNPGLTVLAGENGSGKSAIIDALRLILNEDEYGRAGIASGHFYKPLSEPANKKGAQTISIKCEFTGLDKEAKEQVALLNWLDPDDSSKAILNLSIENKEDYRGRYKVNRWGGASSTGIFEWDLLDAIACIYLPPLRNAEEKLRAFRGSRLARLLKNMSGDLKDDEIHPLEQKFNAVNRLLLKNETIQRADQAIKKYTRESTGDLFGQDTHIQFAEANFDRIVERLQLLFYPSLPPSGTENTIALFRALEENSLGYNNLLYFSTILAELEGLQHDKTLHKVLLIEEPEAHLHPQLQTVLLNYLERTANTEKIQIIVTTHSPVLAASVSLASMKVLSRPDKNDSPVCASLNNCGIDKNTMLFLERWLDITKSTLLFAKSVILVEGIAEALVLPELARTFIVGHNAANPTRKIPDMLSLNGVSVINMGGIYFKHFMQLFKGYFINEDESVIACDCLKIRCAGITDCDPESTEFPTPENPCSCKNSTVELCTELETNSEYCRLFYNLKTFEYDLALEGNNLKVMTEAYRDTLKKDGSNKKRAEEYMQIEWKDRPIEERSEAAHWLLDHISESSVTKGLFAQSLTIFLKKNTTVSLAVPEYIKKAVLWAVGV